MAGIASHIVVPAEAVLVDGHLHLDHLAGGLLGLFVVIVIGPHGMAERALHAERCRNELHGRLKLLGRNALEHLDVPENLFRCLGLGGGARRLRRRSVRCGRSSCGLSRSGLSVPEHNRCD